MAGFRPIGSEKLQGMDKIRRIMEIARYNENIPQNVNETQSSEYKIGLADGNTYEIVKERQGYIVKKTLNESETEYIEPMKQRKYYSSYSQALKRLNLMTKEINTLFENEEGTPLLGEQKKKFILKSKKPKTEEPAAAATPEPAPATEPIPAPAPEPAPMPDMGETPAPDMGGAPIEEPPMPDMGGEEEVDIDVEKKPKEKKISDLKRIQILTGKLAQKIRSYEEEKELDPKDIKYIINSILSAIDVDVLDEDDIEQIINKLEGVEDEEGGSEEEEVSFEEKSDKEEVAPEPPQEPEMAEGYDGFSPAFKDYMGGALASGMSKKLRHEEEDFDMDDEYHRERRKGRKHYPNVDRFEHGTFSESTVDKVLSKYFINEETQINRYEESKTKKTNLNYNQNKQNVIRLSESSNQLDVALEYIKENPRTKLMGLSTRGNLIFKEGINETKITKSGEII